MHFEILVEDASGELLLGALLPKILGKKGSESAVIVVIDLDDRECVVLKQELLQILNRCQPRPRALFRFAIEEMEAWLLGGREAVLKEFPRAKVHVLDSYVQESVCGTWETLADAVFPGDRTLSRRKDGRGRDRRNANGHLRLDSTLMSNPTSRQAYTLSGMDC
jgi:hypothetical protein